MNDPGTTLHIATAEHHVRVQAPARTVYGLLADVTSWPLTFPPTIHVARLETDGTTERIQIWATANGEAKTWVSRRVLDPQTLTIRFRQERSTAPVAAMGGSWHVEPVSGDVCDVRLLHDYRAVDDDAQALAWINRAVDTNSTAELGALAGRAAHVVDGDDLMFSFEDTVLVAGSVQDAFDVVDRADMWPERLPHVASVDFREDPPGLQRLAMRTRARDGSTHETTSFRVTFRPDLIVYKQVQVPALMTLHTGSWAFVPTEGGVAVTSRHTVALNPANIGLVLGEGRGVADAKAYVQGALSANSLATLHHVREHAEALRAAAGTAS